jgi:hypothetical protein
MSVQALAATWHRFNTCVPYLQPRSHTKHRALAEIGARLLLSATICSCGSRSARTPAHSSPMASVCHGTPNRMLRGLDNELTKCLATSQADEQSMHSILSEHDIRRRRDQPMLFEARTTAGSERMRLRCPTQRIRPCALSLAIGRCRSRFVQPRSSANTADNSSGRAHTHWCSLSRSSSNARALRAF